jgi:hypothetical protein
VGMGDIEPVAKLLIYLFKIISSLFEMGSFTSLCFYSILWVIPWPLRDLGTHRLRSRSCRGILKVDVQIKSKLRLRNRIKRRSWSHTFCTSELVIVLTDVV